MADSAGLKTTFDVLARTENEAAVGVLLPALDARRHTIQLGALTALLDRHSLAGQREIVRRIQAIPESWKAIIRGRSGSLSKALRDAVLSTDPQGCANGCQAVLWLREYDLLPALVNALEDEANPNAALVGQTVVALADLLCTDEADPQEYRPRRDPEVLHRHLSGCLEASLKRYSKHKRTEIVEAFLMLASRENPTLKQILQSPLDGSYLPVIETLTHSRRAGILRLLLSYFDEPHAPSAALNVSAHRSDRKFIELLLRKIGDSTSAAVQHNLARLESIAWIPDRLSLLDELDDAAQQGAIQLAKAAGINRLNAFEVIAFLLVKGWVGARRAAAAGLASFHGAEANRLALHAANDEDPLVRAAALPQLRERGIPGALSMLIELIESPQAAVRDAARASLAEFSFARFLAAFDQLDSDVRHSTGLVVKKVDPATVPSLVGELTSSSSRCRIRALEMAMAMEVLPQVEDTVLGLLADKDHVLRIEGARALAWCDSPKVLKSLGEACFDSSVAVRDAAADSLEQISRRASRAQPSGKTGN